jgi:hypothetical protein
MRPNMDSRARSDFTKSTRAPAVSFQEIVHSVLTGNAEVAEAPAIRGTEGHSQECTADTERSREHGPCGGRPSAEQGRRGSPVRHHAEDGGEVGRAVPSGRPRWLARPLLTPMVIAQPNSLRHLPGGRGFAPPAPHRQADRRRTRNLAGRVQPVILFSGARRIPRTPIEPVYRRSLFGIGLDRFRFRGKRARAAWRVEPQSADRPPSRDGEGDGPRIAQRRYRESAAGAPHVMRRSTSLCLTK